MHVTLFTHNFTLISGKAIDGFYFYICLNKKKYEYNCLEKIKRLRKAKGLSQEEMADKLHISHSAYARIETGESQSWATHLEKLSEIFEVRPESFFIDDANNFNNQNQEQNGGMAFQFVGTINTINSLSEKLIEQYEERIQELKGISSELKEEIKVLKS